MNAILLNKPNAIPYPNWVSAISGFKQMGFNIIEVDNVGDIPLESLTRETIPVGGIGFVKDSSGKLGLTQPHKLGYPECLKDFLGREIGISNIDVITVDKFPIFIKPAEEEKFFTGKLIRQQYDLIGCRPQENIKVYHSKPINFLVEYRGYVQFGKLVDCRYYKGDFRKNINYNVVKKAIEIFENEHPNKYNAYSIDFGLTDKDQTFLVEMNDAFSLGNYGLLPINYAKFLYSRWIQISNAHSNIFCTIL